jgi:hypothetical protein
MEKPSLNQTIALQPEEQAHLKKALEQEQLRMQKERELLEKQKRWEAARAERQG